MIWTIYFISYRADGVVYNFCPVFGRLESDPEQSVAINLSEMLEENF